ncbi:PDR/VanB family oxidoreductase [Mycobacteroides abscessus]|uniref:PDR/VanB family oxidoreductase n=1 Tax=Mycobacteroides abscessus TaxID=36809 RepID=UPI000928C1BC|nr:PDR/VanB family oxidoreductase [Mycobacteroides abscessus]MDM2016447.1 PDR/VanB family oxidoreductase [Mycobacteroides abscessus]MDM2020700.1 PDR/VanB family oxidoreductase [Mycobacteroides abscessus]MDM2025784.1 PDR/VanB family oxidoreductase [Mycobacteroides abscessus]MDM2030121.1 PDR/VanB family oxidoreductase [Mycobacteroides abscessus]MDM2032334.1 PDR/VanB family oxidoreductase [Mycobacteroides abscessus]
MSNGLRLRDVPADLYGRRKHSHALSLMTVAAPRLSRLTGLVVRADEPAQGLVQRSTQQLIVRDMALVAIDDDVISLHLEAPDRTPLPRWWPGAHVQVQLPSGLIRHYSLCGDPANRRSYRIAVRRIPGGAGSAEIHETLTPGVVLGISNPHNAFPFVSANLSAVHGNIRTPVRPRHLRFIAGGIGITPILPMLARAQQRGADWSLFYAGRSRESLPFLTELGCYGNRATVHCDDIGGPPTLSELMGDIENADAVYCCGPPSMISSVAAVMADYPTVEFHFERFGSPPIKDGKAFEVELSRSGEILHVPAHRSILDVVRQVRPNTPYACKQGFCGTCRTRVLAGDPDHRDRRLTRTQEDNGDMLICVSRAASERLVLDL